MSLRRRTGLVPVALCALSAHAVVYRSLWPSDGVHGYFGWYEPVVGTLALGALGVLLGALTAAGLSRRHPRLRGIARTLLGGARPGFVPSTTLRYAAGGLAWLAVQEAVEQSAHAGEIVPPGLSVSSWLVAALALLGCALVAALAVRLTATLVRRLVAEPPSPRRGRDLAPARRLPRPRRRRRSLLGESRAVRGPPRPLLA